MQTPAPSFVLDRTFKVLIPTSHEEPKSYAGELFCELGERQDMNRPLVNLDLILLTLGDDKPFRERETTHRRSQSSDLSGVITFREFNAGLDCLPRQMMFHDNKITFATVVEVINIMTMPPNCKKDHVLEPQRIIEHNAPRDGVYESRVHAIHLARIHQLSTYGIAILGDKEKEIGILQPIPQLELYQTPNLDVGIIQDCLLIGQEGKAKSTI